LARARGGLGTRLPAGPGGRALVGLFVVLVLVWTGDAVLSYKPSTGILVMIAARLAAFIGIIGVGMAKAKNER
jgi:hypothetical protein